eukprot:12926607-Prorocentrum_lima.AAC.1
MNFERTHSVCRKRLVGRASVQLGQPPHAVRKRLANAVPWEVVEVVLTCTRVFRFCKAALSEWCDLE